MTETNGQLTESGIQNQDIQPAASSAPEKTVPQSYVNDLVGHGMAKGFDKGHKEGYEKALRELQQGQPAVQNPQQPAANNNAYQMTPDELDQRIAQSQEKARQDAIAKQLEEQFHQKLETGKAKYQDYEAKVNPLVKDFYANVPQNGKLASLVNSMDNTADIMHELAENPSKFANLVVLTHIAPHKAVEEVQKLSNSIKQNEQSVAQAKSVNQPLSQLKPSNTGLGNGDLGIDDYRTQDYLKF